MKQLPNTKRSFSLDFLHVVGQTVTSCGHLCVTPTSSQWVYQMEGKGEVKAGPAYQFHGMWGSALIKNLSLDLPDHTSKSRLMDDVCACISMSLFHVVKYGGNASSEWKQNTWWTNIFISTCTHSPDCTGCESNTHTHTHRCTRTHTHTHKYTVIRLLSILAY